MSNSTTNLDLLSASQANKEVSANSLFDAASPAMLYGRRAVTTAGLTWGYYGGTVSISGTPTQVANGTVTLTASATNYVEADPATGAVSANQTAFTSGHMPLYQVVTGTATVTSYTDLRVPGGGGGAVTSVALSTPGVLYGVTGSPVTGAGTLQLTLIAQAVNTVLAGPASGSSSNPSFRSLVPADLPVMVGSGTGHAAGIVPDPGATAGTTRFLREDGTWASVAGASGGTVTSVGLSVPGLLYTVSGSPVTSSGTLTFALKTQVKNTFLAGPTTGADATPTMRALVAADLPVMGASGTGHAAGAVPDPGATAGTTKFLREDGTWATAGGGSVTLDAIGAATAAATLLGFSPTVTATNGGAVTITAGTAKGGSGAGTSSGSLNLQGGPGSTDAASASNGGGVTIQAGNAGANSASTGGGVTIQAGSGTATGVAGSISIKAGNNSAATPGSVTIQAGDGAATGNDGSVSLIGGSAASSGTAVAGKVIIKGGAGNLTTASTGAVEISTQNGNGLGSGSAAGPVTITGGNATAVGFGNGLSGGAITITAGRGGAPSNGWAGATGAIASLVAGQGGGNPSGGNAGNGGDAKVTAGDSGGGNASGGNVVLTAGAGAGTGSRGHVVLNGTGAALATSATGGFTCMPTCAGAPTGTPANIPTGTVPMVFDTTNFKIWIYVSGAWKGVVLA